MSWRNDDWLESDRQRTSAQTGRSRAAVEVYISRRPLDRATTPSSCMDLTSFRHRIVQHRTPLDTHIRTRHTSQTWLNSSPTLSNTFPASTLVWPNVLRPFKVSTMDPPRRPRGSQGSLRAVTLSTTRPSTPPTLDNRELAVTVFRSPSSSR